MHVTNIDTVYIGCTAIALGAALSSPDDTCIIEPSASILPEWIQAYRPGTTWPDQQGSALGQRLLTEIEQRQIKTKRGVHVPGLSALMALQAKVHGLQTLFMTFISRVEPVADGFDVHLLNVGGQQRIHCQRIIDTTSRCLSRGQDAATVRQRSLSFYLRHKLECEQTLNATSADYEFVEGAFRNEAYVHIPIDPQASWSQARAHAHEFWTQRNADLQQWNCVALASVFFEQVEPVDTGYEQWLHEPAMHLDNALAGIERGVALAQTGVLS